MQFLLWRVFISFTASLIWLLSFIFNICAHHWGIAFLNFFCTLCFFSFGYIHLKKWKTSKLEKKQNKDLNYKNMHQIMLISEPKQSQSIDMEKELDFFPKHTIHTDKINK